MTVGKSVNNEVKIKMNEKMINIIEKRKRSEIRKFKETKDPFWERKIKENEAEIQRLRNEIEELKK